jgi:hypothetical protein
MQLAIVVHAYNPSYFGGRGWEDCDPRTAWEICL